MRRNANVTAKIIDHRFEVREALPYRAGLGAILMRLQSWLATPHRMR